MTLAFIHPAVSALAFFQSTQLNLFERFLTQAVSGIDSTSITAGMQKVAYVILLVGFLWQVYQSALHGGDVRGLGTNLIKYIATALIVMNYHAVFTTINQGFVNAGNWVSSASGVQNLFDNWSSDLQSQFSQIGFQKMWGLITGSIAGLLDALLILVAYILYPIVIVIFGFFYIFYGSVLYIFGPIVIALMPLGATNRLAKSYAENVFIWNAWPILYGGFGALLSAVQMGQVGQMLNQNNFLGGLGSVEGSILIGIASIIYSLAIAIIPFIAKRIVSGDVGSTAGALIGAAATALTAGVAAVEGAAAGVAATQGTGPTGALTSGQSGNGTLTGTTARTSTGSQGNQPAAQQRGSGTTATNSPASQSQPGQSTGSSGTQSGSTSTGSPSQPSVAEQHAERIRAAMAGGPGGPATKPSTSSQTTSSASNGSGGSPTGAQRQGAQVQSGQRTGASTPVGGTSSGGGSGGRSGGSGRTGGSGRPSIRPHSLATWGAYHAARIASTGAMKGGQAAAGAVGNVSNAIAHPTETAGRIGEAAGNAAGTLVNAAVNSARTAGSVARAVTHPVESAQSGMRGVGGTIASTANRVATTTKESIGEARGRFSSAYEDKRKEND